MPRTLDPPRVFKTISTLLLPSQQYCFGWAGTGRCHTRSPVVKRRNSAPMGIHSLLVTNTQGMVLLSRYCDHTLPPSDRAVWERVVYRSSKPYWRDAEAQTQFFITREGISVVYKAINDLIIFIAGSDECDELLLSELMPIVLELVSSACEKKASEKGLLEGDAYGKFSVLLDQMISQGMVEHINLDVLEKLAKLKSIS